MNRSVKLKLILSSMILAACFLGLFSSGHVMAEGDGVSCSLSYSIDEEHVSDVLNGQYRADIGTTTFNANCNDEAGFAIYTVGNSANEYGNTNLVATIGGEQRPDYNIATGTNTVGDNSNWTMKLSALSGDYAPTIENGFNSFSVVPNGYTKAASFNGTTNDSYASLQSTYAVFISPTQPAGSYAGRIKYTLIHPQNETPCLEGQICYRANANNVVGKMGRQTTSGTTAILWASNYSHEGYGFAGWNTEEDGSGTTYGPNETITLPDDMSEGLPLYAVWIKSVGNLQDWAGCASLSVGDVTALTDTRDNDTYAVAKLADGNCWTIENLRLANEDSSGNPIILSSSNTHNPSLPLTNVYDTGLISNSLSPTSSVAYDSTTNPEGWCSSDSASCDNQSRLRTDNTSERATTTTSASQNTYSYGNYYNWYSATVGNGEYDARYRETVNGDICPTSWHLPYGDKGDGDKGGNTSGGFYYLGSALGATASSAASSRIWRSYPNNIVYSGYATSSISGRGASGYYWTATAVESRGSAALAYFGNSSINIGAAAMSSYYGISVRCTTPSVARQSVTVMFDNGVESVTLHSDDFGDKVVTTSGETVAIAENTEYTISATYVTERGFNNWTTTENGILGSASSAETTYTVSGTATLSLASKRICPEGNICYDKNNSDAITPGGDMSNQQVNTSEATLWASNFGRNGYGFAGWNTKADGTGANYGPNETIEFDTTAEEGLMLYAMWVESDGDLQGFVCPDDTTMPIGTVTGLTDTRDSQVYAVAKLADGNCWMIENLRLADKDSNNSPIVLSSANTNNPSLPLTNTDGTTSNSLSPSTDPASTAWCIINSSACDDQSMLYAGNDANSVANMTNINQNVYSYGNYYNWYSATAGNGTYSKSSGVVGGDLCPTGWHLPYGSDDTGEKGGGTSGGFYYLASVLDATASSVAGSRAWRSYPNNFLNSGAINGSSVYDKGTGGNYWSSTANGINFAYRLYFGNSDIYYPGTDSGSKHYGRSVRCVIEKQPDAMTIDDLTYMQDFSTLSEDEKTEVLDSMEEDEQYQLTDSRDNKVYYISKLADGNVWMTQNLDYDIVDGGADIDSTNTDVPSDWADAGNLANTYATNNTVWGSYFEDPESYDPGDVCWSGELALSGEGYRDLEHNTVTCGDDRHYHIGNYYNWTAAVAMSDSSSYTAENEDVGQSLCPAGWKLPKAIENGGSGSFDYLVDQLNLSSGLLGNIQDSPVYFTYSGDWSGNSDRVGSDGAYWSSSVSNSNEANDFFFDTQEYLSVEGGGYRNYGHSLRCVAR